MNNSYIYIKKFLIKLYKHYFFVSLKNNLSINNNHYFFLKPNAFNLIVPA